jgi:hypothetical protein
LGLAKLFPILTSNCDPSDLSLPARITGMSHSVQLAFVKLNQMLVLMLSMPVLYNLVTSLPYSDNKTAKIIIIWDSNDKKFSKSYFK